MNAVIVSVDYSDLLSITVPYNRHHFDQVMIVTTPWDKETAKIAKANQCQLHCTLSFYERGADFNKWRPLEEGIEKLGRSGLLSIMDADILWPKYAPGPYELGTLYGPRRRIQLDLVASLESTWSSLPLYTEGELAGYSQIFWSEDRALEKIPWYSDWKCAGGGDSEFAFKWPEHRKQRTSWECVHLGLPMQNWCGRGKPMDHVLSGKMKDWKLK